MFALTVTSYMKHPTHYLHKVFKDCTAFQYSINGNFAFPVYQLLANVCLYVRTFSVICTNYILYNNIMLNTEFSIIDISLSESCTRSETCWLRNIFIMCITTYCIYLYAYKHTYIIKCIRFVTMAIWLWHTYKINNKVN